MKSTLTKSFAIGLVFVCLQSWFLLSAAYSESKTERFDDKVYRMEQRLQYVEKRSDRNFRYIDSYDDLFAEVRKRLKRVETTLDAHARSLKTLQKRPPKGRVYVPKVERVRRPGGKADMPGVNPEDIEALWRQIDAILAALEDMRRRQ